MFIGRRHRPARDQAWLRTVIDRYETVLLRYAMRRTANWEQAQDLVQSAFLKLIEHREINEDDLPQWLYTVCLNMFLDGKRAEAVRSKLAGEVPTPAQPASAFVALADRDDLDCLMMALATLSALQKRVVELRFMEELSYREIARLIKKTESHVGVLLHEGLKKLREKHEETCGDYLEKLPE